MTNVMLTIIWLIISTTSGFFIGKYVGHPNPIYSYLGATIGLLIGLLLRFFSQSIGVVFDVIESIVT